MNTVGLATLFRMGCICVKESLTINNRRFYIRSRLGEGGFSVIDLLEDARSHHLYALKRVTCHGQGDERIAMREVEVMKAFRHGNLVPLEEHAMITIGHHVQSADEITQALIVMPYYKGGSVQKRIDALVKHREHMKDLSRLLQIKYIQIRQLLRSYMIRRGSVQERMDALVKRGEHMKEEEIWALFQGLCRAVKTLHAHEPPYAHRDIKPANVMFGDRGEAILMDLGSAAAARQHLKTRSQAQALEDEAGERCSMLYRPPELFNVETGTTVDERTDIWSLGCTLYAMAFLESPFEKVYQRGDSIALAVMNSSITFPQNTQYTSALEETVRECLVVNIMERPFIDQILNKAQTLCNKAANQV